MSRTTRKLRILVAAVAIGGLMVLGFAPAALAADDDDKGPAGLGLCIAGVGQCGKGDNGDSSEDEG
jgi:hypothetical protein